MHRIAIRSVFFFSPYVVACLDAQFLDPLLLTLEVYRETHRHVQFLTAAKSMERKAVGFFARLMDSSTYHTTLLLKWSLNGS